MEEEGEEGRKVKNKNKNVPFVTLCFHPGRIPRHDETGNATDIPILSRRPRKDEAMRRVMHARLPFLPSINPPPILTVPRLPHCSRPHVRGIAAMTRLRQSKGDPDVTRQPSPDELLLLALVPKVLHHDHIREVAHDRMLRLQVVEEPQALGRKMLPDDRHPEIRALRRAVVAASVLLGQRETVEARLVGEHARLVQQLVPFFARQATVVPVGARMLAAVVEEALVVVGGLKRLNLLLDEGVNLRQVLDEVWREREVRVLRHVS